MAKLFNPFIKYLVNILFHESYKLSFPESWSVDVILPYLFGQRNLTSLDAFGYFWCNVVIREGNR